MTNQRLEKLKEMEAQKPDDAFLKFAIAQEFVGMNDDATALKYFDVIIERFPQYLAAYYQLGKLYERINELSLATNVYKNGIAVAKAVNDLKTAGELNEALMLLEDE
jgi:Tfp pilus assembly protein PilF